MEGRAQSAPLISLTNGSGALARRGYIKDPGLDPVIAAQRRRNAKGLEIQQQKRSVSGISGGVLHKQLELSILEKEIKQLEEGVEEYQNRIDLMEKEKAYIRKHQTEDREWCATFDRVIGPFEAKYDQCQSEVRARSRPIFCFLRSCPTHSHASRLVLARAAGRWWRWPCTARRCTRRASRSSSTSLATIPPSSAGLMISECRGVCVR